MSAPVPVPPGGEHETDVLVIGAGPVGLFQVFQLGLLEMRAHVVDSLPYVGGQCIELYPDKPIYDIPALPVCTGRELVERLQTQAAPFTPAYHLDQTVESLRRLDDGRFLLTTHRDTRLCARAVVLAAGIGAFLPQTLKIDGLTRHEGRQLFHRVSPGQEFGGRQVLIFGGEDTALECAVRLASTAPAPASVTLVHRRDGFRADAQLVEAMRALCADGRLNFQVGQATGITEEGERLTAVHVTGPDQVTHKLPVDDLLVLMGFSPRLGPIADWGLALERKQLTVNTEDFSTSERGIFAVGDINTYPGKKKLIVCGFHECVLAAFGAASVVFPGRPQHLQYTTTSPRLHELLGVKQSRD